jgi:putative heme-binding domain-containing protein
VRKVYRFLCFAFVLCSGLYSCLKPETQKNNKTPLEDLAASDEVAGYLKAFQGRGALTDGSTPTPANQSLNRFRHPDDLSISLVLSEPQITQPVDISFDHRGRLWVVQYNQYPFPKGVKITGVDNHMRLNFDKVPLPPPVGEKGADKITMFEDTDGDGRFDKSTDVISGLNIATSVALGRGKVWVLSPPYLLAYPDADGDGRPEGKPVVHLEGFGLEDTHAVANSLCWGPDGWLYGGQGSTATAKVSSRVSKNVSFQGQAIWRYHPETEIFEIYAEGGGNTFNVEIDSKGRVYSGNNNADRGPNFKQGAYYPKSLGKHGPHTNPYVFGNLENMALKGDAKRFTHALIKYEGGTLPERYHEKMIALNPLLRYIQMGDFVPDGSTFSNIDREKILETDDNWFRPVAIKAGPDGAVYVSDWYDSRLSHVDPRDTWDKASGRIYKIQGKNAPAALAKFDLSKYSNDQLTELLSNPNKWYRQQALRQFADRRDRSAIPKLLSLMRSNRPQTALEAFWALNLSGGLTDDILLETLKHKDPHVRMWAVKLSGDQRKVSPRVSNGLAQIASKEPHAEVRSQLTCTARRLPASDALPIIHNLIINHDDSEDPDMPLLTWWAIEAKAGTDRTALLNFFQDKKVWDRKIVKEALLKRIMQRYVMAGEPGDLDACTELLKMAPSKEAGALLMAGLEEGLRGRKITDLPANLLAAVKPYQTESSEGALGLDLRQGKREALDQAFKIIADPRENIALRLGYIRILGELNQPASVPVLLSVVLTSKSSGAIRQAALQALQRYNQPEIGLKILEAYPDGLRADPDVRVAALSLFASRTSWTTQLMGDIVQTKKIHKEDVPDQIVRRMMLLNDKGIQTDVEKLWPKVKFSSSAEINNQITRAEKALSTGNGMATQGKIIFSNLCGSCHKLFNEGGNIGPDLSGYDRSNHRELLLNIADPNAFIREGYVNYHIVTNDGRTVDGTITDQNNRTVTIKPFGEESLSLSVDQIKEMTPQKTSLMPERLLESVDDQQIRDLFAYIMQQKKE